MLRPYPKPSPFTWLPITTRPLLPVFPPSDPLITRPILPSPPRQSAFDAPYTLTTHVFPAAYLRTTAHVPVPSPPPENATKAERLEFFTKTRQELTDSRTTIEPQGVPQVLWNCVNRYVRADLDGNKRTSTKGVTLFCAHANGFPKETWEPTLRHLLSSSAGTVIDEVWCFESVQHGDAYLINQNSLSGIFDWTDNARDILNFLIYYLPSSLTASPLPTHLDRVSAKESQHRLSNDFQNRTFVAVGHSFGGCTTILAALTHPQLFSSVILIDPVITEPIDSSKIESSEHATRMILSSLKRRETWGSWEEASKILSRSEFFGAWDPEVLRVYVECGTTPSRDPNGNSVVRLKMPSIHEAIVFAETHTRSEVYQRLPDLDERIELLWIMPEGGEELGPPGSRQRRVWLRPKNSSNIRIPKIGHLIPQEAPQLLADELRAFILGRYASPKARL